jgi:hypothetical protein
MEGAGRVTTGGEEGFERLGGEPFAPLVEVEEPEPVELMTPAMLEREVRERRERDATAPVVTTCWRFSAER